MERFKYNEYQVKGKCQVCGRINHTSIWSISLPNGWFRGDDISLGKFCKNCKKVSIMKKVAVEKGLIHLKQNNLI